jgi:hypothetical protein
MPAAPKRRRRLIPRRAGLLRGAVRRRCRAAGCRSICRAARCAYSADAGATYSPLDPPPAYLDLDALRFARRAEQAIATRVGAVPALIGLATGTSNLPRPAISWSPTTPKADAHRQHRARAAAATLAEGSATELPPITQGLPRAMGSATLQAGPNGAGSRGASAAIGRSRRTAAADRACGLILTITLPGWSAQRAQSRCAMRRRGARPRRIRPDRDRVTAATDRFLRRGRSREFRHRAGSAHAVRSTRCRPGVGLRRHRVDFRLHGARRGRGACGLGRTVTGCRHCRSAGAGLGLIPARADV